MGSTEELVLSLITYAEASGLGIVDLNNAKELLNNREYGLSFDTIVTQMYEHDLEINSRFYRLVTEIAKKMEIPESEYSFIKSLIRDKG